MNNHSVLKEDDLRLIILININVYKLIFNHRKQKFEFIFSFIIKLIND